MDLSNFDVSKINIAVVIFIVFCIVIGFILYKILSLDSENEKLDTEKLVLKSEFITELALYITKAIAIPSEIDTYMDPTFYHRTSINDYADNSYFNQLMSAYVTKTQYNVLTAKFLTNDDYRSLENFMYIYDSSVDPDVLKSLYGLTLKTFYQTELAKYDKYYTKIKDFIDLHVFKTSTQYLSEIITSSNKNIILSKFLTQDQFDQKIKDYIKKSDARVNTSLYITTAEYRFDKTLYVLDDELNLMFDRTKYLNYDHAYNVLKNLIKDYYKISVVKRDNNDSISFNDSTRRGLLIFNKNTVNGKDIRNVVFNPPVTIRGSLIKM